MSAEKMVCIEYEGARIKIPERVVLRNFLDAVNGNRAVQMIAPQDRPKLSEYWHGQGGIYIGDMMPRNGKPGYSMISPIADCVRGKKFAFGASGKDEPGAMCRFDGLANTIALRESAHSHPAADWTAELEIDGHRDFYWPSQCESWMQFMNGGDTFEKGWHWTSTQYGPRTAWGLYFGYGFTYDSAKICEFAVRPVRRIIHSVI